VGCGWWLVRVLPAVGCGLVWVVVVGAVSSIRDLGSSFHWFWLLRSSPAVPAVLLVCRQCCWIGGGLAGAGIGLTGFDVSLVRPRQQPPLTTARGHDKHSKTKPIEVSDYPTPKCEYLYVER